jgi:hypothetical protein
MFTLALAASALASTPTDIVRPFLPSTHDAIVATAEVRHWAGGTVVIARPRIDGLAVDGGRLAVALDHAGGHRRTTGQWPEKLEGRTWHLNRQDALGRGDQVASRMGEGALWPSRAQRVFRLVGETARPAWRVDFSTASPVATWQVWFDASNGHGLALARTSRSAQADVYPTSPSLSDRERVELQGLTDPAVLLGPYVRASSCSMAATDDSLLGVSNCGVSVAQAVADEDGDFLFGSHPERHEDDPQAEVQLYHHVDLISRWADEHGFSLNRRLSAYANFEMSNAFFGDFDGDGVPDLAFGTTESGVDFAYDTDVVYHEFGHAIVGGLSDMPYLQVDAYGLDFVAGSVNEGAADVFSMVLTGDPRTAEYAGGGLGRTAIRDLEADRRCPDDLRGEVHRDGEVFGALGWNLIAHPDVGPDRVADLLFGAIPLWGPDVDWPAIGASVLTAAEQLHDVGGLTDAGLAAVEEELERSRLVACERVIGLQEDEVLDMFVMTSGLDGDLARMPMGTQFSKEVTSDMTSFWLELEADDDVGWSVFVRTGKPVEHETISIEALGLGTAIPTVYDWMVDGAGKGEVRLNDESALRVLPEPGETVYFAVTSRTQQIDLGDVFGTQRIDVSSRSSTAVRGDSFERPGGCAVVPGGGSAGLWLLVLAGIRRRRLVG